MLRQLRDYGIITIAMLLGVVGLNLFLLPHEITTGGIIGVASIVYWGTGIPVQDTFFALNAVPRPSTELWCSRLPLLYCRALCRPTCICLPTRSSWHVW